MTTSTGRALLILADDHRDSLEKDLYKLTAPPTEAQNVRIRADKLTVFQALEDAAGRLPDGATAGILVDEQFGSEVAAHAERDDRINLSMPLEASGEEWFEFAYGDQWREHALRFRTDHAKVLVRDNPGLSVPARLQQAEKLKVVSEWSRETGRALILELLVPATDGDLASVGGEKARYDRELRPGLTRESIQFLQEHGVEPAIWKVEGMDTTEDAASISELARRGGRDADCIVLGRHASKDDLDRWLEIAAPIPGYVGFAIGRSIWWDPLAALLAGDIPRDEARAQIAAAYLDYAHAYLAARG